MKVDNYLTIDFEDEVKTEVKEESGQSCFIAKEENQQDLSLKSRISLIGDGESANEVLFNEVASHQTSSTCTISEFYTLKNWHEPEPLNSPTICDSRASTPSSNVTDDQVDITASLDTTSTKNE